MTTSQASTVACMLRAGCSLCAAGCVHCASRSAGHRASRSAGHPSSRTGLHCASRTAGHCASRSAGHCASESAVRCWGGSAPTNDPGGSESHRDVAGVRILRSVIRCGFARPTRRNAISMLRRGLVSCAVAAGLTIFWARLAWAQSFGAAIAHPAVALERPRWGLVVLSVLFGVFVGFLLGGELALLKRALVAVCNAAFNFAVRLLVGQLPRDEPQQGGTGERLVWRSRPPKRSVLPALPRKSLRLQS